LGPNQQSAIQINNRHPSIPSTIFNQIANRQSPLRESTISTRQSPIVLAIRMADWAQISSPQSKSTIATRQSHRQSSIKSPIANRHSVNRQSPLGNRQLYWRLRLLIGPKSAVRNPNQQSPLVNPIGNLQSQSTIANRHSVNRQSALGNRQLYHSTVTLSNKRTRHGRAGVQYWQDRCPANDNETPCEVNFGSVESTPCGNGMTR
jgi:hypothetical protein